jgi:hypothetical protein
LFWSRSRMTMTCPTALFFTPAVPASRVGHSPPRPRLERPVVVPISQQQTGCPHVKEADTVRGPRRDLGLVRSPDHMPIALEGRLAEFSTGPSSAKACSFAAPPRA